LGSDDWGVLLFLLAATTGLDSEVWPCCAGSWVWLGGLIHTVLCRIGDFVGQVGESGVLGREGDVWHAHPTCSDSAESAERGCARQECGGRVSKRVGKRGGLGSGDWGVLLFLLAATTGLDSEV
jgi:hypothetical protein